MIKRSPLAVAGAARVAPSPPPAQQAVVQAATAAGMLYERHADAVFGFCHSRLGSREEAEDALQTTFVHALRALKRGVVPNNERAWLFTIAQNVCLSDRRAARSRVRREETHDPQALADRAPASEHQADELFGLGDALAEMPERQRQALLLREWQGLSYREIGSSLGLGQAAVETLLFRARRSLAEALNGDKPLRRRLQRALDLVLGAGGLRSLFPGSSGGKVAAATAVAVAAAAGVAGDAPRAPVQPQPLPIVGTAATQSGAVPRPAATRTPQTSRAPGQRVNTPRASRKQSATLIPAAPTSDGESGAPPIAPATGHEGSGTSSAPTGERAPAAGPQPAQPTGGKRPAQPTGGQRPELLPSIGSTLADPGGALADPGSLLPDLPQAPVDLDALVPELPSAPDAGSIAPAVESALPDVPALPDAPELPPATPVQTRDLPAPLPSGSGPGLPTLP